MNKRSLSALILTLPVLALVGCGITSGTVTGKHYEEPYDYTTMRCSVYIKTMCAAYVNDTHHVDEKWVISLENQEGDTGDVSVTQQDYDAISVGDVYTKPE